MTNAKSKKAFIIKNFTDPGAEQPFTAKTIVDLPEGVFDNYEAAGLVRVPTADDRAAAKAEG